MEARWGLPWWVMRARACIGEKLHAPDLTLLDRGIAELNLQ
jgi:hypothetical protein